MEKKFNGYSDALFSIKNTDNTTIVVKKYSDMDSYNRAIIGLNNLSKINQGGFNIQKIKKNYVFENEGIVEYDYINGSDVSSSISRMSTKDFKIFGDKIENYFFEIINTAEKQKTNAIEINAEIQHYIEKVSLQLKKYGLRDCNFLNKKKLILNILNKKKYCKTSCHGDLSLSNILFDDQNYTLIDALDVPYSHYMLDYCRLRLDAKYGLYAILPVKRRISTFEKFTINNFWLKLEYKLNYCNNDIILFHYLSILRILRFSLKKNDVILIKNLINIG